MYSINFSLNKSYYYLKLIPEKKSNINVAPLLLISKYINRFEIYYLSFNSSNNDA